MEPCLSKYLDRDHNTVPVVPPIVIDKYLVIGFPFSWFTYVLDLEDRPTTYVVTLSCPPAQYLYQFGQLFIRSTPDHGVLEAFNFSRLVKRETAAGATGSSCISHLPVEDEGIPLEEFVHVNMRESQVILEGTKERF